MNAELLAKFEAEILGWPGVEKETREDGIAGDGEAAIYRLGKRHVGHVHHDGVADIEFTREVRDEIAASGRAEPHRGGFPKVVSFRIKTPDDIPELVGLFRMGYERIHDRTKGAESQAKGEVENLLATYVETWRRHDMDAWGALFTDNADVISHTGKWAKSNRENVEGHKAIPDTVVRQMANYSLRPVEIAFPEPGIALVHAIWEWPGFIQSPGEKPADREGILTMLVRRREGKWLIRASQNTRIR